MAEVGNATLILLREKIGDLLGQRGRDRSPVTSVSAGVPRGVICEITGAARVEWVLEFLAENPELQVIWIEKEFELLPTSFEQRGVSLSRVFFIEGGDKVLQALRSALRSKVFSCIVAPNLFKSDERKLKAIRLLTEQANATLLLLGKEPQASWTIAFQLEVKRKYDEGGFSLRVLKDKAGVK